MDDVAATLKAAAKADDVTLLRSLANTHGGRILLETSHPGELTILHYAAASGSVRAVRFLSSDAIGADVNILRGNNFSPLHAAAMSGAAEVCIILLDHGARPDVQTIPQNYAPLHSAAWGGHMGTVEVLLRAGARVDLRNYHGETPAETALRQGHVLIAERLEARLHLH